ncbi:Spo0E family sporulation regulatory protein-aspartic acid phosphatase [Halobacillus sp. SY10]
MDDISQLEKKIESVRQEMYEAYINEADYEEVLNISQRLDKLLNQLSALT